MMPRELFLSLSLIASLILPIYGCTPQIEHESPGLANRGVLPLSTNDPYLGANVFLAREMERSSYLYNFLRTHGAPTAIEITDSYTSSPHMVMFYPAQKQVFAAERVVRKVPGQIQPVPEWIVIGPYAIERKDYRELAALDLSMIGEPVFYIHGKEVRFGKERAQTTAQRTVAPVLPPTPPPTPVPVKRVAKAQIIKVQGEPEIKPEEWKPLNSDQQALQMAKGFAERADNGDVIHTVKSDSETAELLTKWYTGSTANLPEVERVNGLATGQLLVPGARLRIPIKLLKKLKVMPADFK